LHPPFGKKVRTKELSTEQANLLLDAFERDFPNYSFVQIDSVLIEKAKSLLTTYGHSGLRTLDCIQLATAILLKDQLQLAQTSDNLLLGFFDSEGLPI
jgi:predicted nucleic acid-binding protein